MAFRKKNVFEALLAQLRLRADELPQWLQAKIRLFNQDSQAAGQLPEELAARAEEIKGEISEWYEEEEEEPVPVPAPVAAVTAPEIPLVVPDPLTAEQVLQQLFGQDKRKVTAKELKAAGFTPSPGPQGGRWGNYRLTKALFGNTYSLTQVR